MKATTAAPVRVAIADDSPAFLSAAASYVSTLPGCELAGTGGALDAPRLVSQARPDVLLLDLGSAPARALAALRRICADAGAPAVIGLSLFYSEEIALRARAAGARALVGKEAFVSGLAEALEDFFAR